jgi:metal-responsive CopG/Arc/MetJ family transcriptional regulator
LAKQKLIVRSVRLDADLNGRVELAAKEHGFANASAFIREAIQRSVSAQETATEAAEQRIAASIDRAHERDSESQTSAAGGICVRRCPDQNAAHLRS